MSGKQIKFLASGALITVALIVWFAFVAGGAATSGAAYDISLKEFRASSTARQDDVRVRGKVEEGSIVQVAGSAELTFNLVEEGEVLPVRYSTKEHGPIPDTFVDGANAIVTGALDGSGVFQAHTLQAKCPSKYEGAPTEGAPAQGSADGAPAAEGATAHGAATGTPAEELAPATGAAGGTGPARAAAK